MSVVSCRTDETDAAQPVSSRRQNAAAAYHAGKILCLIAVLGQRLQHQLLPEVILVADGSKLLKLFRRVGNALQEDLLLALINRDLRGRRAGV